MNRRILAFAALVVALTLPAMLALFQSAGYWESHDGLFHLYRLLALEESWRQGHLYPRLFPEFAFGYGFSVLNFYGPLTYYLALALRLIGVAPIAAMKSVYALSYPLAALGVWALVRALHRPDESPREWAGVCAAALYTYVPYHLADVQLRGALAESWAFVWWGWLFWALWRGRALSFMLALAALVLTHNLSVVLVALPLALWALIALWRAPDRRRWLLRFALATLGAAALTAFYWLPVLLESRYVQISQDVGGLGFANHLQPLAQWLAASAAYHYYPDQQVAAEHPFSWAQAALLALAFGASWWAARAHRALWYFGWGTLLASIFLLTPASYPLWERFVFPFGLIQYPWRWLGISALAGAFVLGLTLAALPARAARLLYPLAGGLLLWLAWSGLANLPYRERPVEIARYPEPMWAEDAANGQVGATWTAEFLPVTVTEQRWALARAPEDVADVGARTPLRLLSVSGDAFNLHLRTESQMQGESAPLSLSRFAYPSFAARTGDGAPLPVTPRGALGVATVPAPPGISDVRVALYPLAANRALDSVLWLLPPAVIGIAALLARRYALLILPLGALLCVTVALLTAQPVTYTAPVEGVATLGNQAQLAAWKAAPARAGTPLKVTLLWFNLEQTERDYVTFIHLTPRDSGVPLAQHDSAPNLGTVPTTRWLAGQLVEDLHLVDLPADLPPGAYQLWAGMYGIQEGQVLPLPGDSGARRLLGEITIAP